MANPRVVVYCEGAGEAEGTSDDYRGTNLGLGRPGDPIHADLLGSAHVLVARCLERAHNIPTRAVRFERGLRTARGKIPTGSQLLDKQVVRQLLTWPNPAQVSQPDMVVLLVDSDDQAWRQRLQELQRMLRDLPKDFPVVGVAHRSIEAWLIADHNALTRTLVLQQRPSDWADPARQAKERLERWIKRVGLDASPRALRCRLAETCDLEAVARACESFRAFQADLCAVPLPQP